MAHDAHDLQLTVLRGSALNDSETVREGPYLESLVLKHSLDGSILAAGGHLGLEDDTKRSIAHDLALGIRDLLGFTGEAILDLFANDL